MDQNLGHALDSTFWTSTFQSAIGSIGHTIVLLAPFDAPLPISRAWCLFEIVQSMIAGVELQIVLFSRERERFKQSLPDILKNDRFMLEVRIVFMMRMVMVCTRARVYACVCVYLCCAEVDLATSTPLRCRIQRYGWARNCPHTLQTAAHIARADTKVCRGS